MQTGPTNYQAMFYAEDIQVQQNVSRDICHVVQDYQYTLNKSRNADGTPVAVATGGSIMHVSLGIGSRLSMRNFYERAKSSDTFAYTIIFDPQFDKTNRLTTYNSCIVVNAYIVNIEETMNPTADTENQEVILHLDLLVNNMTYMGEGNQLSYKL